MSKEETTLLELIAHCELTIAQSRKRLKMLHQESGTGLSKPVPSRSRGASADEIVKSVVRRRRQYHS